MSSFTPSRNAADAEMLVQEVLRSCGAGASSNQPAQLAGKVPWFVAYRFGGSAAHGRFLDRATMQVQAFAGSYDDAASLAETGRTLLYEAWRDQFTSANGTVHKFIEVTAPAELPSGVDGVWRFDGTYSIWTRPALG